MTTSRRAAASHRQGGYALIAVLVAIGVFSLVVMALLDLVSTDTSTTLSAKDTARLRRASDGALQVAIDRLKITPAANLDPTNPCAGLTSSPLVIDGNTVDVDCSKAPGNVTQIPTAAVGATVLTLGGNYNGTLDDAVNNNLDGVVGPIVTGAATWLNAFFANGPGLIHAAGEKLPIVGDVKIRQSGVGLIAAKTDPAIDVTGTYTQGDVGPLGSQQLPVYGWTSPCGLLADKIGGNDLGLRVRATNGPQCNKGRDNVTPEDGPAMTSPASWAVADINAHKATLPSCPAGATVVQFQPGSYTAAQTKQMNLWFQTGNCDNVTFWFPPGDYYFDASGAWGDDPSSIVLNDSTSNWVFGAPSGWTPPARATGFPEACDRSAQGVSITLSSRTAIKHKAGQVAICNRRSGGTELAAIYQPRGGNDVRWGGEPGSAAQVAPGPGSISFTGVDDATRTIPGQSWASTYPALGKPFDTSETTQKFASNSSTPCTNYCAVGITLAGFGDPDETAPSGALSTAEIKLVGKANYVTPYFYDHGTFTMITVAFSDGTPSCTVQRRDVAGVLGTTDVLSVDLLKRPDLLDQNNPIISNDCPGRLTDAMQLETATITVNDLIIPYLYNGTRLPATVSLDYVWIETTTHYQAPPSPFSTVVKPDAGTSLNVYGPVYMPRSQVEVSWQGTANTEPIFVGGLVARGLASLMSANGGHVGVLASKSLSPGARHVVLRAVSAGKVVGTADVLINDTDPTTLLQSAGRELAVVDWKYCNVAVTPTATC